MLVSKIKLHFKKVDPILYEYMKDMDFKNWLNPSESPNQYFLRLVRAIIGQQLSVKAAKTINARFEKLFTGKITPQKILKFPDQTLRDVGMSWVKVKYVKDLSEKTLSKQIHYSQFRDMN